MDFMSDAGIFHAIALARRVKPVTGLQTFATVCSTWVWICRSSTLRSPQNPLGNTSSPAVAEANAMVSRMALLICFLSARFIGWVLEQPASSLMIRHPRMQMIKEFGQSDAGAALTEFHEVSTNMGGFGAATKKPTKLYSSEKWILHLHRTVPPGYKADPEVQTVTVKDGKVTGGRDLKETQAYPIGYGQELFRAWRQHGRSEALHCLQDDISENSDEYEEDDWHDTDMQGLVRAQNVRWDAMPF